MWSFDDCNIGKLRSTGQSLETREIVRPKELTNAEWYKHASAVCKLLREVSNG